MSPVSYTRYTRDAGRILHKSYTYLTRDPQERLTREIHGIYTYFTLITRPLSDVGGTKLTHGKVGPILHKFTPILHSVYTNLTQRSHKSYTESVSRATPNTSPLSSARRAKKYKVITSNVTDINKQSTHDVNRACNKRVISSAATFE